MKQIAILTYLVLFILSPSTSFGEEPLHFVKTSVDEVISILRSDKYKTDEQKKLRKKKLEQLADTLFDFKEISNRALGRNRRKFTPNQLKEFNILFPKLLKEYYIDKIENYSGEKVIYGSTTKISANKYQVNTKVVTSSNEIPINYRLMIKNGKWKVYDVLIEGVSMVKNYRSQFNQILRRKKPEYLLQQLREKIAKQNKQKMAAVLVNQVLKAGG